MDIAIEQRAHFVGHYLVVGNDEDIFLAVLVFPGEGRVPGVVERKVALKQLSGNRNAVVQTRLARIDLGIEVKARQQGEGGFAGEPSVAVGIRVAEQQLLYGIDFLFDEAENLLAAARGGILFRNAFHDGDVAEEVAQHPVEIRPQRTGFGDEQPLCRRGQNLIVGRLHVRENLVGESDGFVEFEPCPFDDLFACRPRMPVQALVDASVVSVAAFLRKAGFVGGQFLDVVDVPAGHAAQESVLVHECGIVFGGGCVKISFVQVIVHVFRQVRTSHDP